MNYRFRCRLYRRPFLRPLATGHGLWTVREGLILLLQDATDRCYWSEIAPLPQFGSETLAAAQLFCESLSAEFTGLPPVPDNLPATQFAFSALLPYGFEADRALVAMPQGSFLLPTGADALETWQKPWAAGYRTFKWKIGVGSIDQELATLDQLLDLLPADARLRLDANGSLSWPEANCWINHGANHTQIEFLEQPVADLEGMLKLAESSRVPLAIDELVSNLDRLRHCYDRGWRGIYVIKPAIAGDLQQLRNFIQTHQLDVVYSSSLETTIGQNIMQRWATEPEVPLRALGMGVASWFEPDQRWLPQVLAELKQTI